MDYGVEEKLFSQGVQLLGAIDEAGRGPLAGPVVAACVVCRSGWQPDREMLKRIKDSKKLTAKKREELFTLILEKFSDVGVGICDRATIDRINILQATFLAMKKAFGSLKQKPDYIILDGNKKIPNFSQKQTEIIKGDEIVFSIAAASIVAKVTRDHLMVQFHEQFPEYNFAKHKGYGTKEHMSRIKEYGPCPIHRRSFGTVKRCFK